MTNFFKENLHRCINSQLVINSILLLAQLKDKFSIGAKVTPNQNAEDIANINKNELLEFLNFNKVKFLNASQPDNIVHEFIVLKKINILFGLLKYQSKASNLKLKLNKFITISLPIYKFTFPVCFIISLFSSKIGFYYLFKTSNNRTIFSINCTSYIHFAKKKNEYYHSYLICGDLIKFTDDYFRSLRNNPYKFLLSRNCNVIKFPVDIVFTWADSLDNTNLSNSIISNIANIESRFNHLDELKYALRSIHLFAPSFRDIYIVVSDSAPSWLNINHPRIKLIKHKDIFSNHHHLPSYNSHAIESQLHHINGLSDHYLYLNDDILFTKPAHSSDYFFSNGIAKHFPSDSTSIPYSFDGRNDSDADLAARNNQTILSQQFSFCFDYKMKHAPFALFKPDIFKLEEIIKDKIDITASNTLRSTDDVSIASSLAHLFSYLNKNSIPSTIDARYIGLDSFWFSLEISKLLITHNKPSVICINEAGVKDCNNARLSAKKIMTYLFPDKSPYEL